MVDIHGMVRELCDQTTHREPYTLLTSDQTGRPQLTRHTWVTHAPPLVTQLWDAVEPSQAAEDGPRPAHASRPAARLDAIDAAVKIDFEASRWLKDLGQDDPGSTITCIRQLAALAASEPPVTADAIADDIRRWHSWARTLTGWDTPARKLHNTCPLCGTLGTLRVRTDTATCIDCWETWGPDTIGLLADHVRAENHDDTLASEVC